jgi:hypothetical protein
LPVANGASLPAHGGARSHPAGLHRLTCNLYWNAKLSRELSNIRPKERNNETPDNRFHDRF